MLREFWLLYNYSMEHHLPLSLHKIKHMLFSPTAVVDSHSHPAYMLQHKKSIHIIGNMSEANIK